jgi:iron-sulfur cluster repair protein YtfE (RIC family)
MESPFQVLLDAHEGFDESLLQHQEALVRGDLASARELVAELQEELHTHIRHEEERLLPVLEERGGWSRIGEPRYYREEHEKIRVMVAALVEATSLLDATDPGLHRDIALLIGREQAFRSLLEHHDDRERQGLFPDLAKVTSPEEQARLLEPPG